MKDINITLKINKTAVLMIFGLILISSMILIATAQLRENIPGVLPIGTNVRAFIVGINSGIIDPDNNNMSSESILVQFYDKTNANGTEIHNFDVLINLSKPATIQSDIVNGIANESRALQYNLTEVFVPDYTRILVPNGTYP